MTTILTKKVCKHCGTQVVLSKLDTNGWCDVCTDTTAKTKPQQLERNHDGVDAARRVLQQARKANSPMSEPTAPDEPIEVSAPPEPEEPDELEDEDAG